MASITTAAVCASQVLFVAVTGVLVLERSPVCPEDSSIYRCTINTGRLDWTWPTSPPQTFSLSFIVNNSGVINHVLGGIPVIFNVTDISPSFTNVIATVIIPHTFTKASMTCNGLTLIIKLVMNLLPTFLTIAKNGRELNVFPNVAEDFSSLQYQISGGSLMAVTSPIIVNLTENITFSHCQGNITFSIDTCLLDDDSNELRNYTLFSNGTWIISRRCSISEIQVTCINDNWSEDIISQDQLTTTGLHVDTTSSSTTGQESVEVTCTSCSQEHRIYYGEIIGSVIGTFVLAHVLGIIFGLVCGIKYTRSTMTANLSKKSCSAEQDKTSSKGSLYEEVELDKTVDLSPNISYDVVKKM